MMKRDGARLALAILAVQGISTPARAAIPPEVEAMIREAARGGDEATLNAVVKVAQATNPGSASEIATLGEKLIGDARARAEQETREHLAAQDFFGGWKGEGEAGFGLTSGNTDELSGVLSLSLARNALTTRQKFSALADYRRTNGATSRQKYAVSYGLDYLFRDGLYVYALGGWERDRFAGYAWRLTQSAGVGYRALKTDAMTLDLDAGPALRQTRYVDGTDEMDVAGRASLAYRWQLNSGMLFTQDASLLSSENNTTWLSRTGLTATLSQALSTRLSFNFQNESNPAGGRKPTDTATRATIVYSF